MRSRGRVVYPQVVDEETVGHDLYEFPMGSERGMRMVNQSLDSGLVFDARSAVGCQPAASPAPEAHADASVAPAHPQSLSYV